MKHKYTDEEIQAAIDEACQETAEAHPYTSQLLTLENYRGSDYDREAPARRDLLKSALDHLPEPQPPTADSKTPGHLLYEVMNPDNCAIPYDVKLVGKCWEECASAVLAAFGGAGLEQAIARMEAVPLIELSSAWDKTDVRGVRARLIAAACEGQPASQPMKCQFCGSGLLWSEDRGAHCDGCVEYDEWLAKQQSQSAEIPWTEWHGGECPLKDGVFTLLDLKLRRGDSFSTTSTLGLTWVHKNSGSDIIAYRVTKWREGFGPATVDWKAKFNFWDQRCLEKENDILLQQARAEKAEPVNPWAPTVGDVVTLKSGGPKMTVVSIKDSEGHVVWFQAGTPRECDFHVATIIPA